MSRQIADKDLIMALRCAIPHIEGTIDRARRDKQFILISRAKTDLELVQEALASLERGEAETAGGKG